MVFRKQVAAEGAGWCLDWAPSGPPLERRRPGRPRAPYNPLREEWPRAQEPTDPSRAGRGAGAAGHGAKVLLADGNYPLSTRTPPGAARVYLNLAPGVVSVTQVLEVLLTAIPVEAAEVMVPADGPEPGVFGEFRRLLGAAGGGDLKLAPLGREAFYAARRRRTWPWPSPPGRGGSTPTCC